MKVLFITARFPYPPLKGDQVVAYQRLKTLSKEHDIILLSFFENEVELQGIQYLQPFCRAIYTVKLSKYQSILNIITRMLFSALPLQVLYYQSNIFSRKLNALIKQENFDVVHAFLLRMAPYLQAVRVPKVLELIDSMQLNLQRRLSFESFFMRQILKEEYRRIKKYEKNIGPAADRLIVVAEQDKTFINSSNVSVLFNGVDTDIFFPSRVIASSQRVIFSGNMGYAPNIHAVKWFVQFCWPVIRENIPNAKFVIAGGHVSQDIQNYDGENGVIVTGFVESIAAVLRTATVAVAPMQSGSGMQNKVLEAMACGLPVVTTTLGLGSIQACNNKNIFVHDLPQSFSQCVIEILQNPAKAALVGGEAHRFTKEEHDWGKAAEKITDIYSTIVEKEGTHS